MSDIEHFYSCCKRSLHAHALANKFEARAEKAEARVAELEADVVGLKEMLCAMTAQRDRFMYRMQAAEAINGPSARRPIAHTEDSP